MGGGDLNAKKAWHPNTLKNQERVWKAEQAAAEEKKRIVELEHERQLERERSELNKLAKNNFGPSATPNDDRLHWMYEKPDKKVQQEEYLLGRAIDKNHEQAGKSEADEIPAVSRRVVGSSMLTISGDTQVDLARKIREDPLLLVKERERAARAALLNNPVQRARLTELLRKEQENKKESKAKKKKKKDKDLDSMLTEKLQALSGKKGIDLATLLASDGESSESSDEKSKKKKKHKKKKSKRKKEKESSSDNESEAEQHSKSKHGSKNELKRGNQSEESNDSDSKGKKRDHSVQKKKAKSDIKIHRRDTSDDYQSSDDNQHSRRNLKFRNDRRSNVDDGTRNRQVDDNRQPNRYWNNDYQSKDDRHTNVGRTTKDERYLRAERHSKEDRYSREERQRRDDRYTRDDRTREAVPNLRGANKMGLSNIQSLNDSEWKRKKRSGLTEEEKAAKLAEMVVAGAEREQQRGRRVAEQLLEKDRADRAPITQSRSHNLMHQLPDSLESRLHSNRHYIQRDQRHMNENFAKR